MKRIGNFLFGKDHRHYFSAEELAQVDAEYTRLQASGKRLVLGTLPSRSGTKWLCDIFNAHARASGAPEPHFDAATFYRYVTYNKLPIDTKGVMTVFKHGIIKSWQTSDITLVFSPHFSHGIPELYKELKPEKIIFAINDPEFTVQSMYNFGFFKEPYIRGDEEKALGYQPAFDGDWTHTFGRLVPSGPFYKEWLGLTRVGKIAWWGSMATKAIYDGFKELPPGVMDIFDLKIADQNYAWYQELAARYDLTPVLSEKAFLALKNIRFKKSDNKKHEWTPEERAEFEKYTQEWDALYKELSPK